MSATNTTAGRKVWRERIRHFTPAWHTMVMGTGALSQLAANFPYGTNDTVLRVIFMFFFMLNFVLFLFISAATVARYVMFPKTWNRMLTHPAQSMFLGAIPMGVTTLINAGLVANQEWDWGGTRFLYFLWGIWWMDSVVSYIITFGLLHVMITRHTHTMERMSAVWLLPVVTLVVASSTGGNIAVVLVKKHNLLTAALVTTGFSFTMVVIGLSLAVMMITTYLSRLILHGPPTPELILSAFVTLGPLGQAGYSLLVNGELLSETLPLHGGHAFPFIPLAGQMVYAICFAGSYILWSMGLAWVLVALSSIYARAHLARIPFGTAYWGLIFPNGVYAALSVRLGLVLDSPFFKVFGASWSVLTLLIWIFVMAQTIPAVWNGSIFNAPCLNDTGASPDLPTCAPQDRPCTASEEK